MTTVEERNLVLDGGHVAVLGHTILDAAAVVAGALDTLRASGRALAPMERRRLEREVDRSIDVIVEASRSLVRGGVA